MTSLSYIFTMEKALVKMIFGRKIFICHRFSNFLCHFLRLLGCLRIVKLHFAGRVLGQGDMKKAVFK